MTMIAQIYKKMRFFPSFSLLSFSFLSYFWFFWLRLEEASGEMLCGGLVVCGAFDKVEWWLFWKKILLKCGFFNGI